MSYILDALRKADAQRERDPARGIHAQPLQASPLARPEGQQTRYWLWGTVVISAGLLAVAAWQLAGPAAPPIAVPVTYSPAAEAGTPPVPAVTLPPPAPPMATPVAPAAEVLPAAPPPPAPVPAAPVAPTAAPLREARKPASVLAAASASATSAADRILSANELPADVQRELPKLAISGGVYSDNPAQRMLIVNGQVLGEGAEPAPGVLLEQIRAKTAVLRYRGYRYAVSY